MKIRILSKDGGALAVKDRIGMEVETRWDTVPDKHTIIIFDQAGLGQAADKLRMDHVVFGAGTLHDGLELNRDFGRKMAESSGLSTQEKTGPRMTVDAFYVEGKRTGVLLSTVEKDGNAFCRIWKKPNPKIFNMTLGKCAFLERFKFTGPLSCECVIHKTPHFVRWIAHLRPHVLWVAGPLLPVVMGLETLNGHPVFYDWTLVVKLSDQPCYLSAEHKDVSVLKKQIRQNVIGLSVPHKRFIDNLDELEKSINELRQAKYL